MPHRRRHPRDRRSLHPERPVGPSQQDRRAAKEAERRLAKHVTGQARIVRRRNIIALFALPILALTLGCPALPVPVACDVPREVMLLAFSAIFGGYLGLSIRLFLDRRRYLREVTPSTS
ncbi:MAG: hypothetical protein EXR61_00070 [Chloroflexi bacterium]|nr:hypothetical protein [Chloroflexota bacterium]